MALFRNPKKVIYIIAVFVALFVAAAATRCHGSELNFGAGVTVARGVAPLIDVSLTARHGAPGDAHWQGFLTLVGDSTYAGREQPNQAALGGMLVDGFGPVEIGLGVAFLQNLDAYNGSHANFSLQLAYRWRNLAFAYRHWSNAGTVRPNLGRDFAILSWGFR